MISIRFIAERLLRWGPLVLLPLLVLVLQFAETQAQSGPTLPPGFTDELVVPGLLAPRAFTFLPDGRMLILERGNAASNDQNLASIRVFKNGTLLATRAYSVNTCGDSERGLLGIAVDPAFTNNGYIYIYYTRQSTVGAACGYNTFTNGAADGPRNRVSRLTMQGDVVVAGSERVLVDNIVTDVGYHNAGDIHFGLDGFLYIATGDGGISGLSQNAATINGKILRILPDSGANGGYTTPGNPFDTASGARYCGLVPQPGGTGPCREVFAVGLRNPFRFDIVPNIPGIPGAGQPIVGDVGGGVWEEISLVRSGGNYGWPLREGPCGNGVLCGPPFQPSGYDDPIYSYAHQTIYGNSDSAVIGGAFYTSSTGGTSYPLEYRNNYFFADVIRGFIRRLTYSNGTWNAVTPDFGTGYSGLIGLKPGPEGDLYYVNFFSDSQRINEVRRIRYTGSANQKPIAQISSNVISGPLSTVYTFNGAGSYDPDNNTPLTYLWDFGDGNSTTTTTPTVNYSFTQAVNRTVTLRVRDTGSPQETSLPVTLNVYPGNAAPSGTIVLNNVTTPALTAGLDYYAGDDWAYNAINVTDDEALPPNAFEWEVIFHHRDHTHPFLPSLPGQSGTFTIPVTGETDPVVWYRVYLRITDARGMTTSTFVDINPITVDVTFTTSPAGGTVTVEGGVRNTPYTITRVVGIRIPIGVASPQTINSTTYNFQSWSQGGAQSQTLSIPASNTTFTANLVPSAPSATPTSPPPTGTVLVQVNQGSDDVNEVSNTLNPSDTTLWVGGAGSQESYLGLRFNNISVPKNATITSATLEMYAASSAWITLGLNIGAEAVDNSATFSDSSRPSQRTLTTARDLHSSNVNWTAGNWYTLDDVAPIIQELVNRGGWQSGNSISLVLKNTGGNWARKFMSSIEGNPALAPRLRITYSGGSQSPTNTPTNTPVATNTATATTGAPPANTLDTFNRANGPVGSNWAGETSGFSVNGDQLLTSGLGAYTMNWNAQSFGADQEVFVTLATRPASGFLCLLLKAGTSAGMVNAGISPCYNFATNTLSVYVKTAATGWALVGADQPVNPGLNAGNTLRARVDATGRLEVFRDGASVVVRNLAGWTGGGLLALAHNAAPGMRLDNFGGSTLGGGVATNTPTAVPSNTPTNTPTATSTTASSGSSFSQVNAGSDDANEVSGSLVLNDPLLWIGSAGSANSYLGLRFNNITVPQGATVLSAVLEFYTPSNTWIALNLNIGADAVDNSANFALGAAPSLRPLTTARVTHVSDVGWTAGGWNVLDDVRPLVQEIINRSGWQAGNSLSLIIRGNGSNWARKFVSSYEGNPAFAPRLTIQYGSS